MRCLGVSPPHHPAAPPPLRPRAGIIQKLNTTDNFMLFTTSSGLVAGGTQETLRFLGSACNPEEDHVQVSRHLDAATRAELMQAADAAWSKPHRTVMKRIPVQRGTRIRGRGRGGRGGCFGW